MSAVDVVEEIKAELAKVSDKINKLPLPAQVELAAHLRAVNQSATQMVDGWYRGDNLVRPGLKQILRSKAIRAPKGLVVLGQTMQATFMPVTMQVLDQKSLRSRRPDVADAFTFPIKAERLSFTIRER